MVPPAKNTLHCHLCLFQAQVELAVEEGRCPRQKSSVDQILEAREGVDAGDLAQGRSGVKVMGGHGGHSTGVDAGRQGQPLGGSEVWMGDLSR